MSPKTSRQPLDTIIQMSRSRLFIGLTLSVCGLFAGGVSRAALLDITDLFNTGVDASEVPLGDNALDPHYTFAVPPPTGTSPIVANASGGFPIPPWLGDNAISAWITPADDTTGNAGDYTYRTTFTIPAGVDLDHVYLTGRWASDNNGVDILLNGASTGTSNAGGFSAFSPQWRIQRGFVTGANTLDFVVNEASGSAGAGGYSGLRVEMTGSHPAAGRVGISSLKNSGTAAAEGAPLGEDTIAPGITLGAGSVVTGPVFVTTATGGFPIPPWLGDNIYSTWVTPAADTNGPEGNFLFEVPFDLAGLDPSTVEIYGRWASDNDGIDILLNGAPTGNPTTNQFAEWTDFTLSGATGEIFAPGANTLTFHVFNQPAGPNPVGVRFEFLSATAMIPEPSVAGLFALGIPALLRRRRK